MRSEWRACLLILLSLALAAPAAAAEPESRGGWMVDARSGCKVWNPHPQPNEGVHWSGECKDGLAHGHGVVQWLRDTTPLERDEGEWHQGRQMGKAVQAWPTGRYEGEVANGEPHGRGVLTLPTLRYEGEFRNGKANGSGTMVRANESFQGLWKDGCFRDGERRAAVAVPLSSCP
jgi:MORN repeat